MHPILFSIFGFPIHSYGALLAISFLAGIYLATYKAKKNNLDPNVIMDVGFYIILAAIVGARLYYVGLHFEEFKGDLWAIFNPFHGGNLGIGGLVMYGGFIGSFLAALIYFKTKKIAFAPYGDALAASAAFGIFITRIGCFLNGCCYGSATHSHIGVSFPIDSPAGVFQHQIHAATLIPSQLIEAAGGLIIGLLLVALPAKTFFPGFKAYLLGLLYAILRFGIDFTRVYTDSERLWGLSHNQIVCIVLFVVFAGLMLKNLLDKQESVPQPVA